MAINKVTVIGSGTMGNGIAHVFALNGYRVVLIDIKDEFIQRGLNTIKANLERQLKKEIITQEQLDSAMGNITASTSLDDAKDADLAVEAATENYDIKKDIFINLAIR